MLKSLWTRFRHDRRLWALLAGVVVVAGGVAWAVEASEWSRSLGDLEKIAGRVLQQPDTAVFGNGLDGSSARSMDPMHLPHPHGFPVLPMGGQVRLAGDADHVRAYLSVDNLTPADCKGLLTSVYTPDISVSQAWVNGHRLDIPTLQTTADDACTASPIVGLSVMWILKRPEA